MVGSKYRDLGTVDVEVHLTQQDIDEGRQRNSSECPWALALCREASSGELRSHFNEDPGVTVSPDQICIFDSFGVEAYTLNVPDSVQQWITTFDAHEDNPSRMRPMAETITLQRIGQ